MKLKLKNLFLIVLLTSFTGFVYGARDNGGQDKAGEGGNNKTSTQDLTSNPTVRGGVQPFAAADGMDSNAEIFYSNAKMYIAPHGEAARKEEPSLMILGAAEFGNSAQINQQGITALTGDFLSSKSVEADAVTLYGNVQPLFLSPNTVGAVRFLGQWNKQEIKRIQFKNASGALAGTVDSDSKLVSANFKLNFPRLQVRKEGITKMDDIDDLELQGAYNPNDIGYVSVATNVAIQVEELDIINGNRFSVDVKSGGVEVDPTDLDAKINAASWYKLNSAYADIRKLTEGTYPGHSEVNLELYKPGTNNDMGADGALADESADFLRSNSYNVGTSGTSRYATFLRGMASPFETLRADYMFYHVLTTPEHGSITGINGPVADPRTDFKKGRGYFYAMDVSSDYFENIRENHHDSAQKTWEYRARGGYKFSRLLQEYKANKEQGAAGFSLYSIDKNADNYEAQKFNVDNVEIDLIVVSKGRALLNILGNPYMAPIYIGDILAEKAPATGAPGETLAPDGQRYLTNSGDVNFANVFVPDNVGNVDPSKPTVKAAHELSSAVIDAAYTGKYALIRPTYWVVNTGFVMRSARHGYPSYAYNVKYDAVDFWRTPSINNIEKRIIEPMQMFILQVAAPGKFVFNHKMKEVLPDNPLRFEVSLADNLNSSMPDDRTRGAVAENNDTPIPDWLIVETAVKGEAITTDRTAVRFYDNGTLGFSESHDIEKQLTPASQNNKTKSGSDVEPDLFEPMNVVYTKSSDGRALLGNGIGYSTKEVPLYYIPSDKQEEVTLTVFGIETLKDVEGAWLIEKDGNGKEIYKQDLLQDNHYTFVSTPVEKPLEADNRFILRFFDDGDDNEPTLTDKPITCYYSGSTLYIGGLNEGDLGSKVQIFDLQGRLMGNTVINNVPSMEYQKALGQGTFIVRITGKRNHTAKFVNTQNY